MTTKHTPGPWFTWEGGVYAGRPKVKNRGELRGYDAKICEMDDMDGTARSRKANAKLIAAAPDLLEALRSAVNDADAWGLADDECDWLPIARAAIARATGEQP